MTRWIEDANDATAGAGNKVTYKRLEFQGNATKEGLLSSSSSSRQVAKTGERISNIRLRVKGKERRNDQSDRC